MSEKKTVCASKRKVTYYWRYCVSGDHQQETVDKLLATLDGYVLNGNMRADAQAQFERRLRAARRGRLTPGDHVKTIRRNPELHMFEIRWDDVRVMKVDPVSGRYSDPFGVSVRLYYIESGESWVVGLHCHEKDFSGSEDDKRNAQNREIDDAAACARDGEAARWGISELQDT